MRFNNYKRGLQTLLLLGMALMLGGCATMQDALDPGLERYANNVIRSKVTWTWGVEDVAAFHDSLGSSNFWRTRNIPDKETLVRDYYMYRLNSMRPMSFEGGLDIGFFPKDKGRLEVGDIIDSFYPPVGSKELVPSGYRLVCKHTDKACLDDPERGRRRGPLGEAPPR